MIVKKGEAGLRRGRPLDELDREVLYGLEGGVFRAFGGGRLTWDRPRLFASLSELWDMVGSYSPTTKLTFGNKAQIRGAVATRRSMPLRYARRERTTIVTVRKPVSECWGEIDG